MATNTKSFSGYATSDFPVFGGSGPSPGSRISLDPTWSAGASALVVELTDDDSFLDSASVDTGSAQIGAIADAHGKVIASGVIETSSYVELTDGAGNYLTVYNLLVDNVVVGLVADAPIMPGTVYEVVSSGSVSNASAPAYADIVSPSI